MTCHDLQAAKKRVPELLGMLKSFGVRAMEHATLMGYVMGYLCIISSHRSADGQQVSRFQVLTMKTFGLLGLQLAGGGGGGVGRGRLGRPARLGVQHVARGNHADAPEEGPVEMEEAEFPAPQGLVAESPFGGGRQPDGWVSQ
ncbi:uncharacterized protein LOC143319999 [Chaetodon auriga]|uniref:uncharacterized protein LOC143319999 n=1 Tax=Chaetodon auriga TaxID=39042 RepID=UPI0040330B58